MSIHDPFDPTQVIHRCGCGHYNSQAEHNADSVAGDFLQAGFFSVMLTAWLIL